MARAIVDLIEKDGDYQAAVTDLINYLEAHLAKFPKQNARRKFNMESLKTPAPLSENENSGSCSSCFGWLNCLKFWNWSWCCGESKL